MITSDEFIWAQKYRPKTVSDCVLPKSVKAAFLKYIEVGEIPNLLFYSESPGTGKTTSAKALCNDLGVEPLFINASLNNGIGELRSVVSQFISTVPLSGEHIKIVILDEADNLSPDAQKGLRALMEEYSSLSRFILTCNNIANIKDAIVSRCTTINFNFSESDINESYSKLAKRCYDILVNEGIEVDKSVLVQFIKCYVPDNRTLLNRLQECSNKYGKIGSESLSDIKKVNIDFLVSALKNRKFEDLKQWSNNNGSTLSGDFYYDFFRKCVDHIKKQSQPAFIILASQYQQHHAIVASKELNVLSFLTELLIEDSIEFTE